MARRKISAKLVKKWPKYGKKLFSRPEKDRNSDFWPRKIIGQNGQKMVKKRPKVVSGPKKGPNSGFWPRKKFRPNWSKNGQNMAKRPIFGKLSL